MEKCKHLREAKGNLNSDGQVCVEGEAEEALGRENKAEACIISVIAQPLRETASQLLLSFLTVTQVLLLAP